jgi:hypothetical protein
MFLGFILVIRFLVREFQCFLNWGIFYETFTVVSFSLFLFVFSWLELIPLIVFNTGMVVDKFSRSLRCEEWYFMLIEFSFGVTPSMLRFEDSPLGKSRQWWVAICRAELGEWDGNRTYLWFKLPNLNIS